MLRFMSLILFIVSLLITEISAEYCFDPIYGNYYCSLGQSCGSSYGDCRGLPTYAIIAIVSSGIVVLSVCIRCCIYANTDNRRVIRRTVRPTARNPRLVQVHSFENNMATQSRTAVPVHYIQEDAPPPYGSIVSSATDPPKY